MELPHSSEQPNQKNSAIDKNGCTTKPDNPQQNSLPEAPKTTEILNLPRHTSISKSPAKDEKGSNVVGKDNFVWDEDLSENAQKIWPYLLYTSSMDYLRTRAAEEGWDLDAAMKEIQSHELLDESFPGYFRILRRKL